MKTETRSHAGLVGTLEVLTVSVPDSCLFAARFHLGRFSGVRSGTGGVSQLELILGVVMFWHSSSRLLRYGVQRVFRVLGVCW